MTSVEVLVDNNNKDETCQKVEHIKLNGGDLEKGNTIPVQSQNDESIPTGKIVRMVLALLVLVAVGAITWWLDGWQLSLQVMAILLVVYIIVFNWRWIYIAILTAPRDLTAIISYIRLLRLSKFYANKNMAMPDILHEAVVKHPNKTCFFFEDESWTFKQVEDYSLRVTAVLKNQGVKPGDKVAVMMNNCPEFPAMWLGAVRLGGISPLINFNQTGNTLIHSITVANCDYVIYGKEFENAIQDIKGKIDPKIKLLQFTRRPLNTDSSVKVADSSNDFTSMLESTAPAPYTKTEKHGFYDKIVYIFTSGTTGLPKAAVISSSKIVFMSSGLRFLGGINSNDVLYCPMPLYHSAGCCVSMGLCFTFGCTLVLKTKFSASNYFKDCIKYNCTGAHYIGEMCRYVLATPPSPIDTQHKVRIVYGNGMRPTVWKDFTKRFNIKRVSEFYGATEGNSNIVNNDNTPGAIGFVSRILPFVYPIAIIKVDEQGEPVRNKKGLCQVAKAYEPGVFIGKIQPNNPARIFLGYVDKEATEKKVLRDVFTRGDSAFISGDILTSDERGYLFFMDRTGDTFRWRGENVSTTEVEAVISRHADQRDAVVYGVEIPNTDGRAGMCGIVDTENTLDLDKLLQDISKDLPKYARPVFIRVMNSVAMTSTFKLQKIDLLKEGYNPSFVNDKLFYLHPKLGKYIPLDEEEHNKIISGEVRL